MAWRSSGLSNDEMVDNLKRFGVIQSEDVERGFRAVDRRFFVPHQNRRDLAHADQPLKEGHIHISAPHIYGCVTEALDLHRSSAFSFLNIGSGTGYLSCIVAEILGPSSSCYGIEIHADCLNHCRRAMSEWESHRGGRDMSHMEFIHGNGLHIDATSGEAAVGFDRIYIGASIERRDLPALADLLRPGGVLVGPVDDELVKIIRIGNKDSPASVATSPSNSRSDISGLSFRPRGFRGGGGQTTPTLSADFAQSVISGVRFAPLLPTPNQPVLITSRIWTPSVHRFYPESFRRSCKTIFLCARASLVQRPAARAIQRENVASRLPRALWVEILSFASRDWFEKPQSEVEILRRRLAEQQEATRREQQARLEAEARLLVAERERDVYRLMAMRWQSRLQSALRQRSNSELDQHQHRQQHDDLIDIEEIAQAASFVSSNDHLIRHLAGLSAIMGRFRAETDDDDDDDVVVGGEDDHHLDDSDDDNAQMDDDNETENDEEGPSGMEDTEVSNSTQPQESSLASSEFLVRSQVRAVSITSSDL